MRTSGTYRRLCTPPRLWRHLPSMLKHLLNPDLSVQFVLYTNDYLPQGALIAPRGTTALCRTQRVGVVNHFYLCFMNRDLFLLPPVSRIIHVNGVAKPLTTAVDGVWLRRGPQEVGKGAIAQCFYRVCSKTNVSFKTVAIADYKKIYRNS